MADNTRYRYVDFIGGRILEAREMLALQNMTEGVDTSGNVVVHDLNALYREGATLNVHAVITTGTTTVTLSPIDNTQPMQVFLHGRWETLRSGDAPTLTLASGQLTLYLNWALNVITSSDDPSLVDGTTGEATANMGELDFSVSATDTSATALGPNQLAKNTSPIVIASFTASGTSLIVVPIDNVNTAALGTKSHAGLIKLSTDTASGVAVATDDPRLVDARPPAAGSVVDASVRTPISNGQTNSDGSAQYDLTADPGGISADKIIWQTYRGRISDFLANVRAQVASLASTLSGHIGSMLGQANTHPMPTASQVGAAPLSHVNLALGAVGSHPATVNSDNGGFVVNEGSTGFPGAPAFQIALNGAQVAAIQHNGDFNSTFLNSLVYNPGGSGITFSGPLGTLFQLAQVVRDHVNQNNHANPHGLTASDIGAAGPPTVIRNGNGTFVQTADGHGGFIYEAWGKVSAPATGGKYTSVLISFPSAFPGNPSIHLTINGHSGNNDGGSQHAETINATNLTPSNVLAELACAQEIGGTGSNGFSNSVEVNWRANF